MTGSIKTTEQLSVEFRDEKKDIFATYRHIYSKEWFIYFKIAFLIGFVFALFYIGPREFFLILVALLQIGTGKFSVLSGALREIVEGEFIFHFFQTSTLAYVVLHIFIFADIRNKIRNKKPFLTNKLDFSTSVIRLDLGYEAKDVKWPYFVKFTENENYLFLYNISSQFYVIPKKAFKDSEQIEFVKTQILNAYS